MAFTSNHGTAEDGRFRGPHPASLDRSPIIKSVQMEEPVNEVKLQLTRQRCLKLSRVTLGRFHTDKNFAVLKRNDIRRPGLIHELPVQPRHPTIGNKENVNAVRKIAGLKAALTNTGAGVESALSEGFERGNVYTKFPLYILHLDRDATIRPI